MYSKRLVTKNTYYVGASDRRLALFENIYPLTNGVSYNSYIILDEKTCLLDTVDVSVEDVFFEKIEDVLEGRKLDYLIVQHMEPDHSYEIKKVLLKHPEATLVTSDKAYTMFQNYNDGETVEKLIIVKEGDTLSLGKHTLTFVAAPMVHWPEVLLTYDIYTKTLFSADAFGTFNALSGNLFAHEIDFKNTCLDEARRYYTNIVGKYGNQVQSLLKKAHALDIKMICPLHGPIWRENLGWFIGKYSTWAGYEPEEKGLLIVYSTIYGNTANAMDKLAALAAEKGVRNIHMYDASKTDVSVLVSECFRYSTIVFASPTYNAEIFPKMSMLITELKEHAFQNRDVAVVENGTWALSAGKKLTEALEGMKNMRFLVPTISVKSSLKADQEWLLEELAAKAAESVNA